MSLRAGFPFVLFASVAAQGVPVYTMHYEAATATMQIALYIDHAATRLRFEAGEETSPLLGVPLRDGRDLLRGMATRGSHDWRTGECMHYLSRRQVDGANRPDRVTISWPIHRNGHSRWLARLQPSCVSNCRVVIRSRCRVSRY